MDVGSMKAGQWVGRYIVPVGVGGEDNMEVGTYIAEQEVGGDEEEDDKLDRKMDERVNRLRVQMPVHNQNGDTDVEYDVEKDAEEDVQDDGDADDADRKHVQAVSLSHHILTTYLNGIQETKYFPPVYAYIVLHHHLIHLFYVHLRLCSSFLLCEKGKEEV